MRPVIDRLKSEGKIKMLVDFRTKNLADEISGVIPTVNNCGFQQTKHGNALVTPSYYSTTQGSYLNYGTSVDDDLTSGGGVFMFGYFPVTSGTTQIFAAPRNGAGSGDWGLQIGSSGTLDASSAVASRSVTIPTYNPFLMAGFTMSAGTATPQIYINGVGTTPSGGDITISASTQSLVLFNNLSAAIRALRGYSTVFMITTPSITPEDIAALYEEICFGVGQDLNNSCKYENPKPYHTDKTGILVELGMKTYLNLIIDESGSGNHMTQSTVAKNRTVNNLLGQELMANAPSTSPSANIQLQRANMSGTSTDWTHEWITRWPDQPITNGNFISYFGAAERVAAHTGGITELGYWNGSAWSHFGTPKNDGQYHHYVQTWDSTTGLVTQYVDGVVQGTPVAYVPYTFTNKTLYMFNDSSNATPFKGGCPYVCIANKIYTQAEISERAEYVKRLITEDKRKSKVQVTNRSLSNGNWDITSGTWTSDNDGNITNTVVGSIYRPSSQYSGTWIYKFNKPDSAEILLHFITSFPSIYTAGGNGFLVQFSSTEAITLWRFTGGAPTSIATALAAFVPNTEYYIAIVRTAGTSISVFIKGGIYTTWTVIHNNVAVTQDYRGGYEVINTQTAANSVVTPIATHNGLLTISDLNDLY